MQSRAHLSASVVERPFAAIRKPQDSVASRHAALRDTADFRERMGADPTSERIFPVADTIHVDVEVYSDQAGLSPYDVAVIGRLTNIAGTEVAHVDGNRLGEGTPGGRMPYSIDFDLANVDDLVPGRYLLTIEATSPQHEEPVWRQVPITISE